MPYQGHNRKTGRNSPSLQVAAPPVKQHISDQDAAGVLRRKVSNVPSLEGLTKKAGTLSL
jgi:hypothetical protein